MYPPRARITGVSLVQDTLSIKGERRHSPLPTRHVRLWIGGATQLTSRKVSVMGSDPERISEGVTAMSCPDEKQSGC